MVSENSYNLLLTVKSENVHKSRFCGQNNVTSQQFYEYCILEEYENCKLELKIRLRTVLGPIY